MPTDLVLAPVGAGKTEWVLDTLVRTIREQPFAPIWVLLPTRRQEDAFRQRLADRSGRVYFNITFFDFYALYARLLDRVGQPQRQLDDTARHGVLRAILSELQDGGWLQVYGSIASMPGFVRIVADFIYELKQNLVQPEYFEYIARSGSPKDRDLSLIYSLYQAKLQQYDLVDREGEGWLALEQVQKRAEIGREVALLLVDGFDQFNPLQAQLLTLLSSRAQKTIVTLPQVPGRENTVGRRFDEALRRLQTLHHQAGQSLDIFSFADGAHSMDARTSHPALRYLTENSFLSDVPRRPSEGCLSLIEAPDVRQEIGAVLRRVKHLLITQGCQPDDILIAVRDWERYGMHLATMAKLYGIPIALHYGEPLANNPAIIALLNLLELSQNDFRRRDLLDVLRSPYFSVEGLDNAQVDLLEHVSQAQLVTGGRSAWLEAIHLATTAAPSDEDDEQEPLLNPAQAEHLVRCLTAFFTVVTAPQSASVARYIRWLEDLIGADVESNLDEGDDQNISSEAEPIFGLRMLRQVRLTMDNPEIVDRDLIALQELMHLLRSLFAAQNLFASLGFDETETVEWRRFLHDLKTTMGSAASQRSPNRSGRVLVTAVSDARGLPHRHVLITGLSEGVFPAPIPEDPLYLDSERRALTEAGIPLETQAERAADEGLFYELIGLAQETLTLSRPSVQNGAFWPESYLWRVVRELFSDADQIIQRDRITFGAVTRPEEVASRNEAALAVAQGMNQPEISREVLPLYSWFSGANQAQWSHIRRARQIELKRMIHRDAGRHAGILSQPELLDWVARELGPDHTWSASQFNDYGMCGFRFYAKRLLKLEKIKEPEEGMDAAQLGTLNHAILEETYRRLSEMNVTITSEYAEQAVAVLHEVAEPILHDAPRRIGFRASALWQQEKITLLRKLEALIRLDFSEKSPASKLVNGLPRRPYRQEVPFSPNEGHMIELPLDQDAGWLKVTGYIDRMDRVGDRVIVVDYKTGSTTIQTKEMQRGRNFQMMLYLLVGQIVLKNSTDPDKPTGVAGGLFWHLRNQKSSGAISLDQDEDQESIQQARQHLSRHIQNGRKGAFAPQPNKLEHGACSHYCEFNQFCRVSIMNRSRRQG